MTVHGMNPPGVGPRDGEPREALTGDGLRVGGAEERHRRRRACERAVECERRYDGGEPGCGDESHLSLLSRIPNVTG